MNNFFLELKNRNVCKVATAYVISAWLIIQVVNTWLYEFTPKGLKLTGAVQQDTIDNQKASRRLNRIIIGTLAFTPCFMLVERVFFAGRTSINEYQKASIAVLPFLNMSSEAENEYFADGLTEQILDELKNLSE